MVSARIKGLAINSNSFDSISLTLQMNNDGKDLLPLLAMSEAASYQRCMGGGCNQLACTNSACRGGGKPYRLLKCSQNLPPVPLTQHAAGTNSMQQTLCSKCQGLPVAQLPGFA